MQQDERNDPLSLPWGLGLQSHRITERLLHSCSFESYLTCDTFRVQKLLDLILFGLYFLY